MDKISSQKMFVDNIDALESFALSVLKRSSTPVATVDALRAIDTSDTILYSDGMTIMVKSAGLYFFDRGNTTADDGRNIIAPATGGGRWVSLDTLISIEYDSVSFIGNVPNVTTNNQTPTFTKASTFANIVSGETLTVLMGKIMRAIEELVSHIANKTNPHSVTKAQVGLGNVDNTSDTNKPVSILQAAAIADAKKAGTDVQTNLANHIANKDNPHGLTATHIGLGNVPNVSTNDQTPTYTQATEFNNLVSGEKLSTSMGKIMKAIVEIATHIGNRNNPHGVTAEQIGLGDVLNIDINNQRPTYVQASTLENIVSGETLTLSMSKIMKAIAELISHLGHKSNPHAVTATQVGLGNVNNTSDVNKPVSTAQATAIADAKSAGTTAQTNLTSHINTKTNPHGVTASQVGLGSVPNVATNDQTPTYTQASTLANLVSGEKLSVSMGKIMKGLADLISHLANKSNPHTVTKAQVGLGNVDNTSDANKPISTAMQAALDGKANMINGEVPTASYLRLTGFSLLNGIDLNTIKYSGQYGIMTNCTNRPVSTGTYDTLEVIMYSSHWLIQRYYVLNSAGVIGGVYMRSYISDSTWTEWKLYNMGTGSAVATANVLADAEVIEE